MGVFYSQKILGKEDIGGRSAGTSRRNTGSMAKIIPFKEVLEQVKRSVDSECGAKAMRRAYTAMKHGSWESFKSNAGRKESSVNELLEASGGF